MRSWSAFILLVLLALPAAGLEPYLVKDINPFPQPADSFPVFFATLGGAALFSADEGPTGHELWRSDGTEEGTWRVADLCPLGCAGTPSPEAVTDRLYFFRAHQDPSFPQLLWATDGTPGGTVALTPPGTALGVGSLWVPGQGVLYFPARDADGEELWRTDGTPAGTRQVADLWPGPNESVPRDLTLFKGRVWFAAQDGNGGALWRSDGTPGGTERVKVLKRKPPAFLHAVGGRLVFVAAGPGRGDELWASDGTARRTVPITRLARDGADPVFYDFKSYGGHLFFVADTGRRGRELWVTDGTAGGTRVLTAFATRDASILLPPTLTGGRLVFAADDGRRGTELWVTDGTVQGTRLVRDVCPGECAAVVSLWRTHRGLLYWVGTNGARGYELWVTDGTAAGTRLVRDVCRGACDAGPSDPFFLEDRVIFVADDGSRGRELWSSDGTASGTLRISDFDLDRPWPFGPPVFGTVAGGKLLFAAHDALHGGELWVADGTAGGTSLVRDINEVDLGGSRPELIGAAGSTAFFFAADESVDGYKLWKSDGTPAGTSLVLDFRPESDFIGVPYTSDAAALGDKLVFTLDLTWTSDVGLWRTDGTAAGTFPLTGEGVNLCCSSWARLQTVGGLVFFGARDGAHGFELWATDGTAAGTRRVADLQPGEMGSSPRDLVAFQGSLYFTAANAEGVRELWRSDGTAGGTVRVAGLGVPHESLSSLLTVHGGRLWFFAGDGEHGRELWSSDGTETGTAMAVDVVPGSGGPNAQILASVGPRLLFSGLGAGGLWATDGTPEGTAIIAPAWFHGGTPTAVFAGRFYYTAALPTAPFFQVLVTDGTSGGTVPLKEGAAVPPFYSFARVGDLLFLSTGMHRELWVTDGTDAGTVRIGPEGFAPASAGKLLPAGPRAFLAAYGDGVGVELWAVEE